MGPSRSEVASKDASPAPRLLLGLAAALVSAAILAGWLWRHATLPEPAATGAAAVLPPAAPAGNAKLAAGPERNSEDLPRRSIAADIADPIGNAVDLKQAFDHHILSEDPVQRRNAARAFDACVPAFLPAAGWAASPEPLINALPAEHRSEREAAYRSLFARCHRLLAEGRTALENIQLGLQRDVKTALPGLRAREAVLAGDIELAEPLVAEALAASDPAAVASLAGLAQLLAQSRQTDAPPTELLQRARAIDVALPLVACDLGLACNDQSLWAQQLCAAEDSCEGDVGMRLAAQLPAGTVDPGTVQQQRARLIALLRSGRTLGLSDLLP